MAVELRDPLRHNNVPAHFGYCFRIVCERLLGRQQQHDGGAFADPCIHQNDGVCQGPPDGNVCSAGDYDDCGTAWPVINGTLPDAIGSLTCRSKITDVYSRPLRAPLSACSAADFVGVSSELRCTWHLCFCFQPSLGTP